MPRCPMRFLLFSAALLGISCASEYKNLTPTTVDQQCLAKVRPPALATAWYDAGIDVVGKHISGLLLIKEMPDQSKRIVFTNEAGVKFFDFGYDHVGTFKVHYVIRQLNKKAVVRLLRDDFSLLLGLPFKSPIWKSWEMDGLKYFGVIQGKDHHYLVTDRNCDSLARLETSSNHKKKLTIAMFGADSQKPDSITLQHHTFAMKIGLKKLIR